MHIFKLHFPGFNRFNRYMVECKYISLNSVHIIRLCFNRYMVECKFMCFVCGDDLYTSFNRYMVECK